MKSKSLAGRFKGMENIKLKQLVSRDTDGDGVIDVLDCEPCNPKKQGVVHDVAKKVKEKYVSWREKAPEREQRREAKRLQRELDRQSREQKMLERLEKEKASLQREKQRTKLRSEISETRREIRRERWKPFKEDVKKWRKGAAGFRSEGLIADTWAPSWFDTRYHSKPKTKAVRRRKKTKKKKK